MKEVSISLNARNTKIKKLTFVDVEGVVKEIKNLFALKQNEIESKLKTFKETWLRGDDKIFAELVFCLLTPQSRAKICWNAVKSLKDSGLLLDGNQEEIAKKLKGVRFKNRKAEYIVEARKIFSIDGRTAIKSRLSQFSNTYEMREWFVRSIKGMGYKEASHFLRNIGFGENMAILDRHILRNLKLLGIIRTIPTSLYRKRYLQIEQKLKNFACKTSIPIDNLDLILWYKDTGEIFK
jgi:N-glycosylase/DNA lyase